MLKKLAQECACRPLQDGFTRILIIPVEIIRRDFSADGGFSNLSRAGYERHLSIFRKMIPDDFSIQSGIRFQLTIPQSTAE